MTDLVQNIIAFAFVALAVIYILYRVRKFRRRQSGCADCRLRNLQNNSSARIDQPSGRD